MSDLLSELVLGSAIVNRLSQIPKFFNIRIWKQRFSPQSAGINPNIKEYFLNLTFYVTSKRFGF